MPNKRNSQVMLQSRQDLVREEKLNGCTYIVAPVVPIVEGVHNGEFISFEEIAMFPEAWDGRPLPIDHPMDSNGEPATAGSPKVMQESVIGYLFNVQAREDIRGISGEIWVDIAKAQEVAGGAEVLTLLQTGGELEVSTAYYCFVDNIPGQWRDPRTGKIEKYSSSQAQVRPDHLALLPGNLGACSWKDGCGAPRVNVELSDIAVDSEDMSKVLPTENAQETVEAPTATVEPTSTEAVVSPEKIVTENNAQVTTSHNEQDTSTETPCGCTKAAGKTLKAKLMKIFRLLDNEEIAEIKEEIQPMTTNDAKKTRVDALISSDKNKFAENHRDWLMSLNDDQIALLEPVAETVQAPAQAAAPAAAANTQVQAPVTVEKPVEKAVEAPLPTKVQLMGILGVDEETLTAAKSIVDKQKQARANSITEIAALPGNKFSKNQLEAMDDATLATLRETLQPASPFRVSGASRVENNEDKAPEPPAILLAKPGVRGVDFAVQTSRNKERGIN
jgi:hypothetical protein